MNGDSETPEQKCHKDDNTHGIFVFGSNLAGRHGKGAALYAYQERGAIYGQGKGLQGTSYAIPTKGRQMERLGVAEIRYHVQEFLRFARRTPEFTFEVTPIGCGLAGYRPRDIAPLFIGAPANVKLPEVFAVIINCATDANKSPQNP
jgi:hypothetical protein